MSCSSPCKGKGENMMRKSMVHKKIIEMADRIVARFNPDKIILFGSEFTIGIVIGIVLIAGEIIIVRNAPNHIRPHIIQSVCIKFQQ